MKINNDVQIARYLHCIALYKQRLEEFTNILQSGQLPMLAKYSSRLDGCTIRTAFDLKCDLETAEDVQQLLDVHKLDKIETILQEVKSIECDMDAPLNYYH